MDYQELKSKPKISEAATESVDSVLRIVVGKDEPTGMLASHRMYTRKARQMIRSQSAW